MRPSRRRSCACNRRDDIAKERTMILRCENLEPPMSQLGLGCENSSACRANISKKLRIMESNDAARAMFDTFLENCNFYISPMYEFLHSQGQTRPSWPGRPIHSCPQYRQYRP